MIRARAGARLTARARRHLAPPLARLSTHAEDAEYVAAPQPVSALLEEEEMMREAAARFAASEVAPHVRSMDEAGVMRPEIVAGLFEHGFMGVEVDEAAAALARRSRRRCSSSRSSRAWTRRCR